MNACDATIRREAELVGAPFRRGGRNEKMWKSKVAEWANADAVAVHTADAQVEGSRIISDAPKSEKPNTGVKLLHARLEMSGDREALLANLRVLLPDEGRYRFLLPRSVLWRKRIPCGGSGAFQFWFPAGSGHCWAPCGA